MPSIEAIQSCVRYLESLAERYPPESRQLQTVISRLAPEPAETPPPPRMGRPRKYDPRRVLAAVRCRASSANASRLHGVPATLIRHYRSASGKTALQRLREEAQEGENSTNLVS